MGLPVVFLCLCAGWWRPSHYNDEGSANNISPVGVQNSIFTPMQSYIRDYHIRQSRTARFEHSIWTAWESLVQAQGINSSSSISALHMILGIQKEKPTRERDEARDRLSTAIVNTLKAVRDGAMAAAANKGQRLPRTAAEKMPRPPSPPGAGAGELDDAVMRAALGRAAAIEETTFRQLIELRAWFHGRFTEAGIIESL